MHRLASLRRETPASGDAWPLAIFQPSPPPLEPEAPEAAPSRAFTRPETGRAARF
jgi:hypothetical protein